MICTALLFILKAIIGIYLVLAFIEFSQNYKDDQRD